MNRARLFSYLCAALWLVAFFFSLPLVKPYEIARLIAVVCLLTAAGLALGFRLSSPEGLSLPRSKLLAAAGLFWLVIIASVFLSPIPFVAFIGACTFSLLPAGALLYIAVPERAAFSRLCAWGGGIVIGALALWVPVQLTWFPALLSHGQVRWPFANPDSYAALLSLGFFAALGLMLAAQERRDSRCGLALAALTLGGIVVIGGAGVMLALAGGLAAFLALVRCRPQRRRAGFLVLAAAVLAAFLLPAALSRLNPGVHRIDFLGAAPGKTESLKVRTAIWRATDAMIARHPLTGTGIGTFFLYYPQFRLPADTDSGGFMAHSDPLQFWAEAGIAAPLLFYIFLALAGWRMIWVLRRLPPEDPARIMPAALFCALAALAVHAHIDFDFYESPILCLCGLLLGSWHEETGKILEEPRRAVALPERWPVNTGWALALLPVIGVIFVLQGFLLSEYDLNRARDEARRGDVAAFIDNINRAGHAGFGANARAYVMAASVPIDLVESQAATMSADEKERHYKRAGNLLTMAERRNPRLVAIPYNRARLARDLGDRDAAEKFLLRALALEPTHLPSRTMLAGLYRDERKDSEALRLLKDGLVWPVVTRRAAEGSADYFNLLLKLAANADDAGAEQAARDGLAMVHGGDAAKIIPPVPAQ